MTLRLLFLMTFHLEFQRIALWNGKFHKPLLTTLQVISQLFELLLSFRCGLSRTVFIISNISIFCGELCPDFPQKPSMIVQKDKLHHQILVYSTSRYNPVNKTNLMHYLSSVYFFNQPLHVSGVFIAHHQEIHLMYTTIGTFCSLQFTVCFPG